MKRLLLVVTLFAGVVFACAGPGLGSYPGKVNAVLKEYQEIMAKVAATSDEARRLEDPALPPGEADVLRERLDNDLHDYAVSLSALVSDWSLIQRPSEAEVFHARVSRLLEIRKLSVYNAAESHAVARRNAAALSERLAETSARQAEAADALVPQVKAEAQAIRLRTAVL